VEPGDEILWREVWRGRAWAVHPVRVVADDGETLVVHLAEGTRLGFRPGAWPWDGGHPWARPGRWRGHGVLMELQAGRRYGVWHFWTGPERRFAGWYLDLQRTPERHARGIDTLDHVLDFWVTPDGTVTVKDDESSTRGSGAARSPPPRPPRSAPTARGRLPSGPGRRAGRAGGRSRVAASRAAARMGRAVAAPRRGARSPRSSSSARSEAPGRRSCWRSRRRPGIRQSLQQLYEEEGRERASRGMASRELHEDIGRALRCEA
jgi:hypothetical protein